MQRDPFELQARVCKCLASPHRLRILHMLSDGEKSFGELQNATGLAKANMSQHLSLLRDRGLVRARREGQHVYFAVANPKLVDACELMKQIMLDWLAASSEAVEAAS